MNRTELEIELTKEFDFLVSDLSNQKAKVNIVKLKEAFDLCIETKLDKAIENIEIAKTIVKEIHLDYLSVIVGLIYDLYHFDESFDIKLIRSKFGSTVAQIVEGIQKISTLEKESQIDDEHLENFRKLLISLSTDVRILLVKLAIRFIKMKDLSSLPVNEQKNISHETMEIYVPFANRFGLRNLKWQLEDLSFKVINNEAFLDIRNKLQETRAEREIYAQKFIKPVEKLLKKDFLIKDKKIGFEISSRAKHIYSIFNKMRLREKPLEELYDLIAMRVIIDDPNPNYSFYVYGIVASIYPPIPETFKDYINSPKKNGYRSIHVAVLGPQRKPVEVQIRTREMHNFAEQGLAAHFNYKRGLLPMKSVFDDTHINQWMDSVKDLNENSQNLSSEQLLNSLKRNLFFEEIHVFTPENEMLSLPKGSTVLDFAYEIHSNLGCHSAGAKVNGKEVGLDYKLHTGDQVEIIKSLNKFPERDELSIVITPKAKSGINKYLKTLRKQQIEEGQTEWLDGLKSKGIELNDMDFKKLYREMNFREKEDFFISITKNEVSVSKAIDFLKFKLSYGFEQNDKSKQNFAGLKYSLMVKGEKKGELLTEILKMLISTKVLNIDSVQLEDYKLKIEVKISVTLTSNFEVRKIMNKLYEIEGISNVRLIK